MCCTVPSVTQNIHGRPIYQNSVTWSNKHGQCGIYGWWMSRSVCVSVCARMYVHVQLTNENCSLVLGLDAQLYEINPYFGLKLYAKTLECSSHLHWFLKEPPLKCCLGNQKWFFYSIVPKKLFCSTVLSSLSSLMPFEFTDAFN